MKAKYWKSAFKKCVLCKELLSVSAFTNMKHGDLRFTSQCKFCRKDENKLKRIKNKIELIKQYSKGKNECQCCHEKFEEFLTLDHIGNSKKELKHHTSASTALRRVGFLHKDKLRILCINCNFSIGKYGYCPHKYKGKTFIDRCFIPSGVGNVLRIVS